MNIRHRSGIVTRIAGLALGLALLSALPAAGDMRLLSLATKDLIYDPGRQRVCASVPNDGSSRANTVTMIDPQTGVIGPSIPVGSDPGKMALSDDGRYLYVGLDAANAVRRVDLQTQQPDLQFSVNIGQEPPYVVDDMQVVPGSPRSVAVLLGKPGISPRFAGVLIYDDGVPRPKRIDPYASGILEASRVQFGASPATLYALDEELGDIVVRMAVDASGMTVTDRLSLPSRNAAELRFSEGLLYLSSGEVVDPQTFRIAGSFGSIPPPSLVLPDPASGRIFFLSTAAIYITGPPKLLAFDLGTRQPVGAADIPVPVSLGGATSLLAWGQALSDSEGGLAFRTDQGQVVLLRTRLRAPNLVSADLAVTGTVLPNPARVGDPVTIQLSVSNSGPDSDPDAVLSSVLPAGTTFVSVTSSQGRCSRSGAAITCDLGALLNGARATVTLVVRPTLAGTLIHTATVHGQAPDPYSGNNTATQRTISALPVPSATGPGQSLPVFAVAVQQLSLMARDLLYDRVSRRIYASVPSSAGAIGNSVVPIDPVTGAVGVPIPVGSEPGRLALSDDGRYLYVALDGAAAVRRVDLPAQMADLEFRLGTDPLWGPVFAEDLAVLPGSREAVAVLLSHYLGSGGDAGIGIYDNGAPRGRTAGNQFFNSTVLQFAASPSRLYAYNGKSSEYGFRRLAVDDLGVSILDVVSNLIAGYSVDMKYDQGLIFSSNGRVIDPEERTLLGTVTGLDDKTLVAPDHAAGQVFYLTGDGITRQLRIVASNSFLPLASLAVPNVRGQPGRLIRWGQEQVDSLGGLAFLTDANQLFLLRLALVSPTDLTLTLPPGAIIGGGMVTGTVTLSRPAPAGGAMVLLSSASPAAASVPPSVLVPSGATSATFTITTRPVQVALEVDLTASYAGVDRTASLQLLPAKPPIAALSISPGIVVGGFSALGTVQLASPAPPGGRGIGLSTGNPVVVSVPPFVIVPAGATTATFPIRTHPVTYPTLVPIWAAGGEVRTAVLWVLPIGLTLSPTSVHAGRWVTGAIILPQPAPKGGAAVSLTSSMPGVAPVPAQVTVPAGETTATFYVKARPVIAPTPVTLTATYNGTIWKRSLTVAP
jgi:uncharacterized repeat protein (TIGR01451 family)